MKIADFPKPDMASQAIFRISESNHRNLERLIFQRYPYREWGTFFRFGYRRTSWGLALSYIEPLPPKAGDLDRSSPIVSFSPDYIASILDELEDDKAGIGVIHSHPLGFGVVPSPSDDDMDQYYAQLFASYGGSRPYVSLIANKDQNGKPIFSGRAYDEGTWMPVSTMHVPGDILERYQSKLIKRPVIMEPEIGESVTARWQELVGEHVKDRFGSAVIGVVGCSGTGSPAVEVLARAGVCHFVLVDWQRLSRSNLERIHGSCFKDLSREPLPYKVELMARLIKSVNPKAKVTLLVGNVLDDLVIDELLRCDAILGCTDTVHGRIQLGDLASHYLVPSVDVGVLPKGKDGKLRNQHMEFMRMGVSDPCPYCLDRISTEALAVELMSEEEQEQRRQAAEEAIQRGEDGSIYWSGGVPQIPAVGYLTTAAGAMAAGYALNWLLGSSQMPHSRLQIDVGLPEFAFVSDGREKNPKCSCSRYAGFGDLAERSVTMPPHFTKAFKMN